MEQKPYEFRSKRPGSKDKATHGEEVRIHAFPRDASF
jgi:hypothetical protein